MLPVKADALHPYQTAAFYVLFLIIEKQTCICLEVELIEESPVDGRIWLEQMHILGHQLVGDKAEDTVFLFHLAQLARPVAQSINVEATIFQELDQVIKCFKNFFFHVETSQNKKTPGPKDTGVRSG